MLATKMPALTVMRSRALARYNYSIIEVFSSHQQLVHVNGLASTWVFIPYTWLFSMVVYFTNWLSFSISRILISRMAAISKYWQKYFKILYFTN